MRHSGCSRIGIRLEIRDGEIYGVVEDNGEGLRHRRGWAGHPLVGRRPQVDEGAGRDARRDVARGLEAEGGTRAELRVPLDGLRP